MGVEGGFPTVPGYRAFYGSGAILATRSPQRVEAAQKNRIPLAPQPVYNASSAAEGENQPVIYDVGPEPYISHVVRAAQMKLLGGDFLLQKMIQDGHPDCGLTVVDQGWSLGDMTFAQHKGEPWAIEAIVAALENNKRRHLLSRCGLAHRTSLGGVTTYQAELALGRLRASREDLAALIRLNPCTSGGLKLEELLHYGLVVNDGFYRFAIKRISGLPLSNTELTSWGCIFRANLMSGDMVNEMVALAVGILPRDINKLIEL
jgi:hypothetical protein